MEILDIVDENGIPTGETADRAVIHREGLLHHTSHVWLLRRREDRTQVLLQKRSENKDSFPGCYDISSAGHIPAGCGYTESALRELEEELGVRMDAADLHSLGLIRKSDHAVFHGIPYHDEQISMVFYAVCDMEEENFRLQEEEVSEVRWMDLQECREAVRQNSMRHCIYRDEIAMLPELD